jgi:hypothetical protein
MTMYFRAVFKIRMSDHNYSHGSGAISQLAVTPGKPVAATKIKDDSETGRNVKKNVISHLAMTPSKVVALADIQDDSETGRNVKVKVVKRLEVDLPTPRKVDRREGKLARQLGLTVAQQRRRLGELVRAGCVETGAAGCHAVIPCSFAVFRAVVAPRAGSLSPRTFNQRSAVVLAEAVSPRQVPHCTRNC